MSLLGDNHVYSYTQLQSVDECPYGFYLSRIDKVPQTPNAFASQGTLVHDLIDKWAKGEIPAEKLPEVYAERYPYEVTEAWPKMLASKGYAEKAYNLGLNYFENFDQFAGYTIIDTEKKFRTEIAGRPFVGVVDMILRDDLTDEMIVLDHKSKTLNAFKKSENEMYRQQLIYSKYFYENYGRWPDRLMFNLFKENGLKMERPFTQEEYEEAIAWAEAQIDKIERYDLLDWFEMKDPDFFCQELCGSRKECPNGKEQPRTNRRC